MKICIFASAGPAFGSGHQTRMQELYTLLKAPLEQDLPPSLGENREGWKETPMKAEQDLLSSLGESRKKLLSTAPVEPLFFSLQGSEEALPLTQKIPLNAKEKIIFLLDLRDIDPRPFLDKGPVLALDNRHPIRKSWEERQNVSGAANNLDFYDTLPHPEVELKKALEQALISPLLLAKHGASPSQPRAIFCAGPFTHLPELYGLFTDLLAQNEKNGLNLKEILWLGSLPKDKRLHPLLSFTKRSSRQEFFLHLKQAQLVFCYPGMGFLEAWFLGKMPILFATESELHNQLGRCLQNTAKMVYLQNPITQSEFLKSYRQTQKASREAKRQRPSGQGYALLLQRLTELLRTCIS